MMSCSLYWVEVFRILLALISKAIHAQTSLPWEVVIDIQKMRRKVKLQGNQNEHFAFT